MTTMDKSADHEEAIKKLNEMIKDIRIAMLTTFDENGELHCRPMATQEFDFDGDLWFFTGVDSSKSHEIAQDQRVNLSYIDVSANRYISVTGTACLIQDEAKAKELWHPFMKAWFPDGPDDSNLALLKVRVARAEYWESPSGAVVKMLGFLTGARTGRPVHIGENQEIRLND